MLNYNLDQAKKLAYTEDDIDDIKADGEAGKTVEKGDEVTLYVNAYGEIVMVATDNAGDGSDWTFAYVRSVKEVDENDDDQYYATLRLLMFDGNRSTEYSVVVDTADYKPTSYTGTNNTDIEEFDTLIDGYVGKE